MTRGFNRRDMLKGATAASLATATAGCGTILSWFEGCKRFKEYKIVGEGATWFTVKPSGIRPNTAEVGRNPSLRYENATDVRVEMRPVDDTFDLPPEERRFIGPGEFNSFQIPSENEVEIVAAFDAETGEEIGKQWVGTVNPDYSNVEGPDQVKC